jgi:hypothetical protein
VEGRVRSGFCGTTRWCTAAQQVVGYGNCCGREMLAASCVKTRRCGEPIEWTFRPVTISAVRILKRSQFRSIRERSFSSVSSFRGFHTA